MAYSTATRHFVLEAATWLAAAAVVGYSVVNYDTLKGKIFAAASPAVAATGQTMAKLHAKTSVDTVAARAAGGVELKVQADGHFHAEADINGRTVAVLVDTGATHVALPYEAAEHVGIYLKDSDFKYATQTANGTSRVALTTIDTIAIGDILVRNVQATVHQRGSLSTILLGMGFLSRLSRVEMRPGALILHD